jgi:hypothetical protein
MVKEYLEAVLEKVLGVLEPNIRPKTPKTYSLVMCYIAPHLSIMEVQTRMCSIKHPLSYPISPKFTAIFDAKHSYGAAKYARFKIISNWATG